MSDEDVRTVCAFKGCEIRPTEVGPLFSPRSGSRPSGGGEPVQRIDALLSRSGVGMMADKVEAKCWHGFTESQGCGLSGCNPWHADARGNPPSGFLSWGEYDSWRDYRMSS